MAAVALILPSNNWDVIGYVAAAMRYEIANDGALHAFVYEGLREAVGEAYPDFVRSAYMQTVSKDPESLRQVMAWYQVRPAYVLPIFMLAKIGIDPFLATHLISVTAVFLGLLVFYLAVREQLDPMFILILPLFVVGLGVFEVSRLSTPDALVFLVVAATFYFFIEDSWLILLLLPLSLLARGNLLVFNLMILAFLFVSNKRWRVGTIIAALFSLLIYWGVHAYYGHYGYTAVFYSTFVENLAYPAQTAVALTFTHYRQAFIQGALDVLYRKEFLTFLTLLVLAALLFGRLRPEWRTRLKRPLTIALIGGVSVVLHFILFPAMWPRFFSGHYFMGAMALLLVLSVWLERGQATDPKSH